MSGDRAKDEGLDPDLDLWWIGVEIQADMAEAIRSAAEPVVAKMQEEARRLGEQLRTQFEEQLRQAARDAGMDIPGDETND